MMNARTGRSDGSRERGHRGDGADTECGDVFDRCAACRQRECRKHAEEVRAAGDAVQDTHEERCVRMAETASPRGPRVHVQVIVRDRAVMMRAGGDVQSSPQRPEPNRNERDADDPFTPGRQDIDRRQKIAQNDRQQRDDDNTGRVAEPPGPPGKPSSPPVLDREGRDSGEMVWP